MQSATTRWGAAAAVELVRRANKGVQISPEVSEAVSSTCVEVIERSAMLCAGDASLRHMQAAVKCVLASSGEGGGTGSGANQQPGMAMGFEGGGGQLGPGTAARAHELATQMLKVRGPPPPLHGRSSLLRRCAKAGAWLR
jgi:hypothetical protein